MSKTMIQVPADTLQQFAELAIVLGRAQKIAEKISKGAEVPDDQAWFWTPEWQAMEREADEDIANGDTIQFENMDEAIKYLNELA